MVLESGHFGKYIRNAWKDLKCGAGGGWRKICWTDRVRNAKVLHRVMEERNILHKIKRKLVGWVTCCVGTVF
jgi:hypothetical protein